MPRLSIDIEARLAQFQDALEKSTRIAKRQADSMDRAFAAAGRNIRNTFAGIFGGIGIAALMRTFTAETVKAQNAQAQLRAVVESTGSAAGFSVKRLNEMAEELAKASTFHSDDIREGQARLLSYTGIVGEELPRAMRATVDMATRMGSSVSQAAEQIGRALDVPSKGLSSLQDQGFRFTEEQKKAVEQLEKTGRTAEAQAIVLDALESSYGGAAVAARDTFGGALAALQNQVRGLMAGEGGSLEGARTAIERLTETMSSQSTKEAFATLTKAFAELVGWTAKAISATVTFAEKVGDLIGETLHGPVSYAERLKIEIEGVNAELGYVEKNLKRTNPDSPAFRSLSDQADKLRAKLEDLQKTRALAARVESGGYFPPARTGGGGPSGQPPLSEAEIAALAAQREAEEARKRAAEAAAKQAAAYVESLRKQLQGAQQLTVVEKTLEEIREGALRGGSKQAQQQALAYAASIDAIAEAAKRAKESEEELQALISRQSQLFEDARKEAEAWLDALDPMREFIRNIERVDQVAAMFPEMFTPEQIAKIKESFNGIKEEISSVDEFALQAARNIQSSLGDSLFNILDGKFDDIGRSFGDLLKRMAAEALAANLAQQMFGDFAKTGKVGGWAGQALSALGGLFGGGRASGGPVSAGTTYLVGERGPELFTPTTSGAIVPNHAMGGVTINSVVNAAPGTNPAQLKAYLDQRDAQLKADLMDGMRRGRYPVPA